MMINSYSLITGEFSPVKVVNSLSFENLVADLAVEFVLKDETIIFYYSDFDGEKLYSLDNNGLELLISTKEEIVDFEFR